MRLSPMSTKDSFQNCHGTPTTKQGSAGTPDHTALKHGGGGSPITLD